ncbi:hypothetical protein F441_15152 [Phytophthora nicotianae CJ01A1]|uniref:RxLR effector protein n=4 Tax=Phytophthora nicotianae TaxID=4792 RepID=V9EJC3_PHYNI|nr:hypothetical protein F443_15332 [Phytophthora nicotianae P1569]ETK79240.1 hypothetical protein L915_14884 [Phytophthora nicotianae]ETO67782.1 hypothetical protein F444_15336 [Phytophthora nicotianae P1976]ETP08943.1 hypothetical protein F441_15152 [Phytophthora nicotianae CJ01A1]ETL32661.1 hypothetical protein L916_14788 [Phytophthora nicotianae]
MRLAYIFTLVIATTLHASGFALPTATNPRVRIQNEAPEMVEAINADGGRLLRRIGTDAKVEEERTWNNFGKWLKKQIPLTEGWKEARKVRKGKEHMARFRRNRENIRASIIQ